VKRTDAQIREDFLQSAADAIELSEDMPHEERGKFYDRCYALFYRELMAGGRTFLQTKALIQEWLDTSEYFRSGKPVH